MRPVPYRRAKKSSAPLLRRAWGLCLGLAVGLLLSLARGGGFFSTWQLRSTDFLHGDTSPGDDIVIVTIDDASVAQLGSWPWPHSTHARLIGALPTTTPRAGKTWSSGTLPENEMRVTFDRSTVGI